MLKRAVLATALAVMGGQAMADLDPLAGNYWNQGGVVTVSCFRGPLTVTAWDHPEAIFVDSLVADQRQRLDNGMPKLGIDFAGRNAGYDLAQICAERPIGRRGQARRTTHRCGQQAADHHHVCCSRP